MSDHISLLLERYHDGELPEGLRRPVQAHLEECPLCRAELQNLRKLSAFLQQHPAPQALMPAEDFAARVLTSLPAQKQVRSGHSLALTLWQLLPFGLIGAWAFAQSVFFIATTLSLALDLGIGASLVPWLPSMLPAFPSVLTATTPSFRTLVESAIALTTSPSAIQLVVLATIGLLYWGWLAGWWAFRDKYHLSPTIQPRAPELTERR